MENKAAKIDETAKRLMELFPQLTRREAEALAKTGDDIEILITRVLDNNIEPPTLTVQDFCGSERSSPVLYCAKSVHGGHKAYYSNSLEIAQPKGGPTKKGAAPGGRAPYNYPEIFEIDTATKIDPRTDTKIDPRTATKIDPRTATKIDPRTATKIDPRTNVAYLRKRASELHRAAGKLYEKGENWQQLASEKREKAKRLNRDAVLVCIKRILESGVVDLHGFTVDEAVKFMDDYYRYARYDEIRVITGQEFNSSRVRPAIKEWLVAHGFEWKDDGPCVVGTIKIHK